MAKKSTSKPKTTSTPTPGGKKATPRKQTGGSATGGAPQPSAPATFSPPAASVKAVVKATGLGEADARQLLVMGNAAKARHGLDDAAIKTAILSKDANGKSNGKPMLTRMMIDKWSTDKTALDGFTANAKLLGLTPQQLMEGEAQSPGHVQSLLAKQTQAATGASTGSTATGATGGDIDPDEEDDDIAMTNVPKPRGLRAPATDTDIGDTPEEGGQVEVKQPIVPPEQFGAYLQQVAREHLATLSELSLSNSGSVTARFGVGKDVASGRLGTAPGDTSVAPSGAGTGGTPAPQPGTPAQTGRPQPANANASRLDRSRTHAALNAYGFTDEQIRGFDDTTFQDTVSDVNTQWLDQSKPEFAQRSGSVDAIQQRWKKEDWDKAPWTPQAPPGWSAIKKTAGPPLSTAAKFLSRNAINIGGGLALEEGILPAMTSGAYPGIIRYLSRQANSQQPQQQQQQQQQGMYPQQDFSPVEEDPLPGFGGPPADYFFQQQPPNPAGRPPQR